MRYFGEIRVRRVGLSLEEVTPHTRSILFVAHAGIGEDRLTTDEVRDVLKHAAARWNAVLDALAEYNDPNKDNVRCTGDRMADILRNALNA